MTPQMEHQENTREPVPRCVHPGIYSTCSMLQKCACVGGMASLDLTLVVKICILAESTLVFVHVLSYNSTTYLSNTDTSPSMTFAGLLLN